MLGGPSKPREYVGSRAESPVVVVRMLVWGEKLEAWSIGGGQERQNGIQGHVMLRSGQVRSTRTGAARGKRVNTVSVRR